MWHSPRLRCILVSAIQCDQMSESSVAQFFQRWGQKVVVAVFASKAMFSKIAQNSANFLGYIYYKICCLGLLKIANLVTLLPSNNIILGCQKQIFSCPSILLKFWLKDSCCCSYLSHHLYWLLDVTKGIWVSDSEASWLFVQYLEVMLKLGRYLSTTLCIEFLWRSTVVSKLLLIAF